MSDRQQTILPHHSPTPILLGAKLDIFLTCSIPLLAFPHPYVVAGYVLKIQGPRTSWPLPVNSVTEAVNGPTKIVFLSPSVASNHCTVQCHLQNATIWPGYLRARGDRWSYPRFRTLCTENLNPRSAPEPSLVSEYSLTTSLLSL